MTRATRCRPFTFSPRPVHVQFVGMVVVDVAVAEVVVHGY